MTFERNAAPDWHRDVPGARWFKADLHVHPIDDACPRRVLQAAAQRQMRVLGLTPHSPRAARGARDSEAWRIVEEWNAGSDDDGVPFRNKIYAVFPGFEQQQAKCGLRLLFLFDPEIGRDDYLRAFDLVIGATPLPDGAPRWNHLTLASNVENENGLLGAQQAQVLQLFQHHEVAGLELGDDELPEDLRRRRPWLEDAMAKHRQAFFHASAAYSVDQIGRRHTWLKLASPRIEALRQAFIASDSRMRIGYERSAAGKLVEIAAPDVTVNERPWLKSVRVKGRASFFGGQDGGRGSRFDLSPDLTCIIGGSMTGKSTLLDGLRVHVGAPLPRNHEIRRHVEARGREGFLGASPEVTLECPGRDPAAEAHDRWPAVFHAQSELQRLAQEPVAVQDILARLVAPETKGIKEREARLRALDRELENAVKRFAELDGDVAEAEQAFDRSGRAVEALESFADAGLEDLHRTSRNRRDWENEAQETNELGASLDQVLRTAESFDALPIDAQLAKWLHADRADEANDAFRARWDRLRANLRAARDELAGTEEVIRSAVAALSRHERDVRTDVDRKLAGLGMDGATIKEFQVLSRQAALHASYEANLGQARAKLAGAEREFRTLLDERQDLVARQREAFDRVIERIRVELGGRISARRTDDGDRRPLESFLHGLNQRGVTRWWNDLADANRPSPRQLLGKLDAGQLATVGMSDAVQTIFRGCLGRRKRMELAAVRCPDRYALEFELSDGTRRPLGDLSGGQRVSVLLSLLLEASDDRPLVIDQPEDELDNRFLIDTVLPALKRLKGRRQIIVATHNANIVVNGDADQVIQLEATAKRGRVALAGAIEEPAVRDAIVRTVDGGGDAFRLRRLKYGF